VSNLATYLAADLAGLPPDRPPFSSMNSRPAVFKCGAAALRLSVRSLLHWILSILPN
jgi:hypothetical protein